MSGTVQIIVAVITVLPALIAAIYAADTKRHVDTKNGKKLGAYTVEASEILEALKKALDQVSTEIQPPSGDKLGEVAERTHDLAAVTVAQTSSMLKKVEDV